MAGVVSPGLTGGCATHSHGVGQVSIYIYIDIYTYIYNAMCSNLCIGVICVCVY